jgi:hypothetical protein
MANQLKAFSQPLAQITAIVLKGKITPRYSLFLSPLLLFLANEGKNKTGYLRLSFNLQL